MAVKDKSLYHATEDLILSSPRVYYGATIHTSHWQLRSLISSPQEDIVYYPSENDIVRLNTKTREREVITTLSFPPRCLKASGDWVCCGGDDGHYVAVCLDERKRTPPSIDSEPDARLPLDLDLPRRSSPHVPTPTSDTTTTPRGSRGPVFTKATKIGTEIVNCIELWEPTSTSSEKAYKIPVAVVSNNDRTVSIVDVSETEVLEELLFPDCINKAVISPDGELLIALCDDPYLYVHERVQKPLVKRKHQEAEQDVHYEWRLRGRIQLEGQKESDRTVMRGSFAASFSSSGKYLAVATQYGVISIFDTETIAIEDADSLLEVFTSSRPGREAGPGAVRAMQFSPAPFDLLAWTESSGRACVADLRDIFRSRQLLKIDSHAEGVERVTVTERVGEPVIDPRLRSFRAESPYPSGASPDYMSWALERNRQLRHLTREMMDRHQAPLTSEELEVLQAHRIARRQRDAANDAVDAAREALSELAPNQSRPAGTSSRIFRNSQRLIPAAPALRDYEPFDSSAPSIGTYISDRNQDRERRSQLDSGPRYLGMFRPTGTENGTENEAGTENNSSSNIERLTLTVAPGSATIVTDPAGSDSSPSPWPELDALYRSRPPPDPPAIVRATRARMELAGVEQEDEDVRTDFANRLRQPWRLPNDRSRHGSGLPDEPMRRTLQRIPRTSTAATMGCSWSQDGRILYIGTEEGIFEYHVNVAARKKFPSLVLR